MIRDENLKQKHIFKEGVRLNNKTEFNKFVDYVEKRTGIEFYGDLGEADAISDYKEATGRDLDYLIGGVDDEEGHQLAYITLGYSVGKRGDEDFNYLIEPTEGEPVYEDGLPTWKEAADKVVEFVKKILGTGLSESRQRRGRMLKESNADDVIKREEQSEKFLDWIYENDRLQTVVYDVMENGECHDDVLRELVSEASDDLGEEISFDAAELAIGTFIHYHGDLIDEVWGEGDMEESNRRYGRPLFEDIEVPEPQGNPFKVGDILAGTWGYSMTIPMFVQVIGVTPKSVRCRQLRVLNDDGFQGHDAMARKDDFEPENRNFPNTFLARVKGKPGEEYVMCPSPRCYLRPWDGRGLSYDHMD